MEAIVEKRIIYSRIRELRLRCEEFTSWRCKHSKDPGCSNTAPKCFFQTCFCWLHLKILVSQQMSTKSELG